VLRSTAPESTSLRFRRLIKTIEHWTVYEIFNVTPDKVMTLIYLLAISLDICNSSKELGMPTFPNGVAVVCTILKEWKF
jgi:hypothetical protein